MNGKKKFYLCLALFQVLLLAIVVFTVNGLVTLVVAQTEPEPSNFDYYNSPTATMLALSSAIAIAASVLASAWAIRTVGTAAISSLSEREETFFKAFLIVALCESLAVFGLIVGILLWTNIPKPPA